LEIDGLDRAPDPRLESALTDEERAEAPPRASEPGQSFDRDAVSLHQTKARHQTDQRNLRSHAEGAARGRAVQRRMKAPQGNATGQSNYLIRGDQPARDALASEGVGHGPPQAGRPAIEPTIERVRPDGLDDVPRANEGFRRPPRAVGHRREPMLLAAV